MLCYAVLCYAKDKALAAVSYCVFHDGVASADGIDEWPLLEVCWKIGVCHGPIDRVLDSCLRRAADGGIEQFFAPSPFFLQVRIMSMAYVVSPPVPQAAGNGDLASARLLLDACSPVDVPPARSTRALSWRRAPSLLNRTVSWHLAAGALHPRRRPELRASRMHAAHVCGGGGQGRDGQAAPAPRRRTIGIAGSTRVRTGHPHSTQLLRHRACLDNRPRSLHRRQSAPTRHRWLLRVFRRGQLELDGCERQGARA